MKKSVLFILVILAFSGIGNAVNRVNTIDATLPVKQDKELKRYEVKSGMIEYVTSTSGKVLGSVITGSSTEKLFFKDWGAVELKEEKSSQTSTIKIFGKGKTETTNTHTINKLDNSESYFVDFDKKQITAGNDMAMGMIKTFQPDADAGAVGEDMLESMGGEKTGTEKFLGYDCDVWSLPGGKQWIYKGVMLKLEMTILGIKTVTQAQSATFNETVADKYFTLPDFPIHKNEDFQSNENFDQDMEDANKSMEAISKMSYEEWKKTVLANDEEMQNMSEEELHQTYDMMQEMIKKVKR